MIRVWTALLLLGGAGAGTAFAQKAVTLHLPWAADAAEAKKQATASKQPIAVCFIQRTCRLSMLMVKALHEDGRIYDLKDRFVWLCVDPTRKEDFKWFLSECGDAVEGTPTIFFVNEKGQYADPKLAGIEPVCGSEPGPIIAGLRAVLGRFQQDLPEDRKKALAARREEADKAADADPARALGLLRAVVREGEGWASMEEAVQSCREAEEALLQKGMQKVREVLGRRMEPAEALKALETLAAAYPESGVSHWCAREVERLKKAR